MDMKGAWHNAYYRATVIYVALIVTTILSIQIYRVFISAPAKDIICDKKDTALSLLSIVGVLFNA